MRLIAVVTQKTDADMTWNLVNQATWAVVEANFAIISGKYHETIDLHGHEHRYSQLAACLPTMRPVWLAIRQRSRGTKLSEATSYQKSAKSQSKQRVQPSWATEILKSNGDDEYLQSYSTMPTPGGHDSRYGLGVGPDMARTTVAIPLPAFQQAQYGQEQGAIRVENGWDVEYSDRSRPRHGV